MNSVTEMLREIAQNPLVANDIKDRARWMLFKIDPDSWAASLLSGVFR